MRLSPMRVEGKRTQRHIFNGNWTIVTITGTIELLTEM